MTITAIVFDVGNVLVSWDLEFLYRSVIEDPDVRGQFLAEVLTAEMNRQMDAGRSVDEALAELVDAHPDRADWILAFRHRWIETMGPQIDGSVELFDQLQATGLPIYALTNFGAETWPVAQQAYPVLTRFDGEIVSGREGLMKPDPRIYRLLTDRFGLDPETVFFTDDNQHNVDAARAEGWHAVLFTSADQLLADLQKAAIL
ncbi:MAG: HAD family phosphatase [Actinomycetota bacterium]|nr:HAD family phosphatase [Actinomycetota bacterium]